MAQNTSKKSTTKKSNTSSAGLAGPLLTKEKVVSQGTSPDMRSDENKAPDPVVAESNGAASDTAGAFSGTNRQQPAATPRRKKRVPVFKILLLLLVVGLAIFLALRVLGEDTKKVGDSSVSNFATYLSKSSTDPEKKKQSAFQKGDHIQVALQYKSERGNAAVRFVVISSLDGSEVFRTNLFKLNPAEDELFVSINNQNLEAGSYVVEAQDSDNNVLFSEEYIIE